MTLPPGESLKRHFHDGQGVTWGGRCTGTVERAEWVTDWQGEPYWSLVIRRDDGARCRIPEDLCRGLGEA